MIVADVASTLNAAFGSKLGLDNQHLNSGAPLFVAHALRGEGFDASEDGTGRGVPLVPVAIQERAVSENVDAGPGGAGWNDGGAAYTLEARNKVQAVAFDPNQITSKTNRSQPRADVLHTMPASATPPHLAEAWAVRRLMPVECERLQGFPDSYTLVPGAARGGWRDLDDTEDPEELRGYGLPVRWHKKRGCWRVKDPDGPRYKALGNSMAVNIMEWLGERIDEVDGWT